MSEELKARTKRFALDVISACAGMPQVTETRHAIRQVIRSSSSVAANYRSACRGKSKADFISKLGTVEEALFSAASSSKKAISKTVKASNITETPNRAMERHLYTLHIRAGGYGFGKCIGPSPYLIAKL